MSRGSEHTGALRRALGGLLMVGVRGSDERDHRLQADLDACAACGVRAVVLFDVDVGDANEQRAAGVEPERAQAASTRNIVSPDQLRRLCATIRERLGPDTIIAVDQEGGRVARLSPRHGFPGSPNAAEFANLEPDAKLAAARSVAKTLRDAGIDLNLAPCVDVACNPANPVIAGLGRAFGKTPDSVIENARVWIRAHDELGVGWCLKHFPGHGSSEGDSHLGVADISGTWDASIELPPFATLLGETPVDRSMVMCGHLVHRGLDAAGRPASLSRPIITDLLRQQIGYGGVVCTDSLDMRAIADRWGPGAAAVEAIAAGADLVLDGNNLESGRACPAPAMIEALEAAVGSERLPMDRVEESTGRLAAWRRARRGVGSGVEGASHAP